MNNKTIISLLVILLIFLYWRNKRGKLGMACADLWDNMSNDRAEELFVNAQSLHANDPNVQTAILQEHPNENELDYHRCYYTTKYLYERENPVITLVEKGKIEKCICEKFKR